MYTTKTTLKGRGFIITYSHATKTMMAALASSQKYYRLSVPNVEFSSKHKFLLNWDKEQDTLTLYKDGTQLGQTNSIGDVTDSLIDNNFITIGGSSNDHYPLLSFKMADLKIWNHLVDVLQLTESLKTGFFLSILFLNYFRIPFCQVNSHLIPLSRDYFSSLISFSFFIFLTILL